MKTLIDREGVTSFKLFMAYPGVLMVDDGALFKAMRVAGANGAMTCIHAENGPVIQVLVRRRWRRGMRRRSTTRSPARRSSKARRRIAPSAWPSWPGRRSTSCICPRRGAVGGDRGARPRHPGPCRDLPALSVPDRRGIRAARLRGRQVRDDAAAARSRPPAAAVARAARPTTCRWCRPTTARSASTSSRYGMKFSKQQGVDSFSKIPNGAPGVETRLPLIFDGAVRASTACRSTASSRSRRPRRPSCSACSRARARSRSARTATSCCSTRTSSWTIRAAEHHSRDRLHAVRGPRGHRTGEEGVPARAVHRRRGALAAAARAWGSTCAAASPARPDSPAQAAPHEHRRTCASTAIACSRRLAELAAIGATGEGGCCRLALTDEDRAGRDLVVPLDARAGPRRARSTRSATCSATRPGRGPERR